MAIFTQYRFNISAFIAEVRKRQQELGRALCGCSKLSDDTLQRIEKTVSEVYATFDTQDLKRENAVLLLKRFEELCRRQKTPIPPVAHAGIAKHLISEVLINAKALEEDSNKLISVTIYRGAIGPILVQKFPKLSKGTLRHAVAKNSFDPEKFCENVETTTAYLNQLCSDPNSELYILHDTPWIHKHLAIHNLSDPVKGAKALVHRITTYCQNSKNPDDEFHCFVDTQGLFKYAAVHHLTDMPRFLRGVKKNFERLVHESNKPFSPLSFFKNRLGALKAACIGYPSDPEGWLNDVIQGRAHYSEGLPIRPAMLVESQAAALKAKVGQKVGTSVEKISTSVDRLGDALDAATKGLGFGTKKPGGYTL